MKEVYDAEGNTYEVPLDTPTRLINGERFVIKKRELEKLREEQVKINLEKERERRKRELEDNRKNAMPSVEECVYAIAMQFNSMRMNNQLDLIQPLDNVIGRILAADKKHPKPEDEEI